MLHASAPLPGTEPCSRRCFAVWVPQSTPAILRHESCRYSQRLARPESSKLVQYCKYHAEEKCFERWLTCRSTQWQNQLKSVSLNACILSRGIGCQVVGLVDAFQLCPGVSHLTSTAYALRGTARCKSAIIDFQGSEVELDLILRDIRCAMLRRQRRHKGVQQMTDLSSLALLDLSILHGGYEEKYLLLQHATLNSP